MKNILLFLAITFALTACNQNSNLLSAEKVKTQDVALTPPPDRVAFPPTAPNQNNNKQIPDATKKIVKEGTISFETADLTKTRSTTLKTLQNLNGYVSEENQSNDETETRKEYNLKIRVPAQNFDRLLDTISLGAEKIDTKNISITDITTKYIDEKTRFNNKKLLENRYNQLLAKATKISDLLEIEDKLTEIRSDIESAQGQLNYMNKQVAYSSLDVTFYTKTLAQESGNTFGYRFNKAVSSSWDLLQSLFFGIIALWPFIVIGIIIIYVFLKRIKKQFTVLTSPTSHLPKPE